MHLSAKGIIMWKWSRGSRRSISHYERKETSRTTKYIGNGITIDEEGVSITIKSNSRRIWFYQTYMGQYSLYYAVNDDTIYISFSAWEIQRETKKPPKIAKAGAVHVYSYGAVKRYEGTNNKPPKISTIGLANAVEKFGKKVDNSLRNSLVNFGEREEVALMMSGGVDSLIVLDSLLRLGVKVHAYCCGVSPDDFDPRYAKAYCDQLEGVTYHYVPIYWIF